MPKVVTQDDIIGRFRGVHGDRYDYSKTVYNGSKQKVVVTCKEHGLKVVYFCDNENASYYDGTDYIFFTAKDEMMKYIKDNEGKVGE